MKKMKWYPVFVFLAAGMLFSCHQATQEEGGKEAPAEGRTPVTVTQISTEPLSEYIELNAVSAFLQKSYVKANANGYLQSADTYLGKFVSKGQLLFTLKTKESQSLGNSINELDWSRKTKYRAVNDYLSQIIHLRRNHPAFRMPDAAMIAEHLAFLPVKDAGIVAYTISGNANGDRWKRILVAFNGNSTAKTIGIPKGKWKLVSDGDNVSEKGIKRIKGEQLSLVGHIGVILAEE